MKPSLVALAVGMAAFTAVAVASADTMDPALERLTSNVCTLAGGMGVGIPGVRCYRDNAAFKQLINQYGFAFAPSAFHSARTTGYGGFHLSIEGQYTSVDSGADYMKRGTQGPRDEGGAGSVRNDHPASWLQLYSFKLRKSFGLGFELMGTLGMMPQTSLVSAGADVRFSILEGFRNSIPGYLPDVALGGGVRTITGTPEFQLTVAGLDIQISKPFALGDSSILTPWIGYQYVWIWGDSGLIDLTPGTNPIGTCNYAGVNVPGNPDQKKTEPDTTLPAQPKVQYYDGQPVCLGGSSEDFNNNIVFSPVRLERQRILLGLAYRYEMVMVGGQFITDVIPVGNAQVGGNTTQIYDPATGQPSKIGDKELFKNTDRQYTLVFELGLMF